MWAATHRRRVGQVEKQQGPCGGSENVGRTPQSATDALGPQFHFGFVAYNFSMLHLSVDLKKKWCCLRSVGLLKLS